MTDTLSHTDQLAINGGPKAFATKMGQPQPKIGVEELFAIAERFGVKPDAMARLRDAISNDDLQGNGPNLAVYACPFPAPSSASKMTTLAQQLFDSPFALPVSSGTGALHAAMVAVGAGPGKDVIVPAMGFMATAAAVAVTGATPVFCDVDESMHLDPRKLEACITPNTVAVVPTHHWGMVADMDPILAVAAKHNLHVIEDCAQSPGATYKGKFVGTIGDVGCFSISAYKIIGGGEGGMVLAREQRVFDRVCQLAECGGLWRQDRFAPEQYEGELFAGTNYRMSDLEATVNIVQLQKLEAVVNRTRKVYQRIVSQLISVRDVRPQKINDRDGLIGYQLRFFPVAHELSAKIAAALVAEGVGAGTRGPDGKPDWHLCSEMFPLRPSLKPHSRAEQCPVAMDLFRREVAVGVDQWMTETDCDAMAAAINKVLTAYSVADENAPAWG
jgi:8-amino-3,8-dideoxy-alpha-D-manno-octulosonate transaminase